MPACPARMMLRKNLVFARWRGGFYKQIAMSPRWPGLRVTRFCMPMAIALMDFPSAWCRCYGRCRRRGSPFSTHTGRHRFDINDGMRIVITQISRHAMCSPLSASDLFDRLLMSVFSCQGSGSSSGFSSNCRAQDFSADLVERGAPTGASSMNYGGGRPLKVHQRTFCISRRRNRRRLSERANRKRGYKPSVTLGSGNHDFWSAGRTAPDRRPR